MHIFNKNFLRLVELSPLSQKELAQRLSLSESAIVNYKRDRIPKAEELLRIASFFDVPIEHLLLSEAEQKATTEAVARANAKALVGPAAAKVLVGIIAQLMNEAQRLDPNVEFPQRVTEKRTRYGK